MADIIPEDLILFKLPCSKKPGSDLISRSIARHQVVVDFITTTLLKVKEGTYTSTNTTFMDGTECDVLYIPHSSRLSSLSPTIIEFQQIITRLYYLAKKFRSCIEDEPFFLQTPSNHFAKLCYLITKDSIESTVNKIDEHMNPIVAFAHFLISGQQSIIGLFEEYGNGASLKAVYYRMKKNINNKLLTQMDG
ncbi:unnamed protein product [Cunninghamella blakesleeana]